MSDIRRDLDDIGSRGGRYHAIAQRAKSEIERLQAWQDSAIAVLAEWDAVWEAAGRPGHPGESKAEAVHEWINRRNLGQAAH